MIRRLKLADEIENTEVAVFAETRAALLTVADCSLVRPPPLMPPLRWTYLLVCLFASTLHLSSLVAALKEVLKSALVHDGLARGLREAVVCTF